jgi:hypothetical protein
MDFHELELPIAGILLARSTNAHTVERGTQGHAIAPHSTELPQFTLHLYMDTYMYPAQILSQNIWVLVVERS